MHAPIAFDVDDAQRAADEWGFNCGPAAICAVFGKTPEQVRPHMQDFEAKRYTNPTLMWKALRSLGVSWTKIGLGVRWSKRDAWPSFGLVRIQWGGPWTEPGVPMRVRYRHTHWVASDKVVPPESDRLVFDVNATCSGGWIPFREWSEQLVPWLLRECEPKADGKWWITHAVEIVRP